MRWLIVCLLVLFTVAPAMAEDPYIALCPVAGSDTDANTFYLSPKYIQFLYPPTPSYSEDCLFRHSTQNLYPEICDLSGSQTSPVPAPFCEADATYTDRGNTNYKVAAQSTGFFTWTVMLTRTPTSEINLALQCGVVKPQAFEQYCFNAIAVCAGETGERVLPGCTHRVVDPGFNPIKPAALPFITATVAAGVNSLAYTSFHLTAFRNPGAYQVNTNAFGTLLDSDQVPAGISGSLQVLDGADLGNDPNAKILLKACMDKTVVVKLPVTGQVNALGEVENDLAEGDIITVNLYIPRDNTVDIYCNSESLKVMGIGD